MVAEITRRLSQPCGWRHAVRWGRLARCQEDLGLNVGSATYSGEQGRDPDTDAAEIPSTVWGGGVGGEALGPLPQAGEKRAGRRGPRSTFPE